MSSFGVRVTSPFMQKEQQILLTEKMCVCIHTHTQIQRIYEKSGLVDYYINYIKFSTWLPFFLNPFFFEHS